MGALATMSPGEFFPSFDMIATTLGEEGKFKHLLQACARDETRDLRLFGGPLSTDKVETNMKVIPSRDFQLIVTGEEPTSYAFYMNHNDTTYPCYGRVAGGHRRCQRAKGQVSVKWNSACVVISPKMANKVTCHAVGVGGLAELGVVRRALLAARLLSRPDLHARHQGQVVLPHRRQKDARLESARTPCICASCSSCRTPSARAADAWSRSASTSSEEFDNEDEDEVSVPASTDARRPRGRPSVGAKRRGDGRALHLELAAPRGQPDAM